MPAGWRDRRLRFAVRVRDGSVDLLVQRACAKSQRCGAFAPAEGSIEGRLLRVEAPCGGRLLRAEQGSRATETAPSFTRR